MKTNYSVPFFYDPQNPWSGAGTVVIDNKDGNQSADDNADDNTGDNPGDQGSTGDAGAKPADDQNSGDQKPADTNTGDDKTGDQGADKKPADTKPADEPAKSWRETVTNDELISEVTKKIDRKSLLKAAGLTDDVIEAIDYKDQTGDWTEYLRIKNTDYTKMPFEQLVEMDLRKKYASLDKEDFEIIKETEMAKYHLDREDYPDGSKEAKYGSVILKMDGEAIRAKLIEEQGKFKAPEKQPDPTAQEREVFQTKVAETIRNSDVVKNLLSKKLIPFGAGEEALNYEVTGDLNQIIEAAISAGSQQKELPTPEDITRIMKTLAYHMNPDLVENALINHGKVYGNRAVRKEMSNSQPNSGATAGNYENLSDAQLLAKAGTVVNGNPDE